VSTVVGVTEASYLRAIRAAYDTVAVDYAEILRNELAAKPLDRALLSAFAELVQVAGVGPVADVGCGPGRITAHLHGLGVSAFGVDLSAEMVAVSRRTYPDLRFDEGSMTALDVADDVLGGVIAWYSIIHTPPEQLPAAFAEFHRVLGPGGYLLLAFQVGDERVRLQHAYGHPVSLDAYRLSPERIAELLHQAGLVVIAQLVREPDQAEKVRQANIVACKPDMSSPSNPRLQARHGPDIS
jgi:SAM-dependent methyltransferase